MSDSPEARGSAVALLIEDDEKLAQLYAEVLRRDGFSVVVCGNLRSALDLLRSGFVPWVCVVDLHLPNGKGLDVVRQLEAIPGRSAFVLISGIYNDDWAEEAFRISSRVQQYILKTRIAATNEMAAERGLPTLAKLCRDAMARYATVCREKTMDVATALARSKPRTPWTVLKDRIATEFASRRAFRWFVRCLAGVLLAGGAVLSRYGASHDAGVIEACGAFLTATGGGLGILVGGAVKRRV